MIKLETYKSFALTIGIFISFSSALFASNSLLSESSTADSSKASSAERMTTNKPEVKLLSKSTQKSRSSLSKKQNHKVQTGVASYYGPGFHGRRTANGEKFNMHAMTAAHRTLPFGTKLKVTNTRNGQHTIVRVNDRGPYIGGRVIDLSVAAAKQIGSIQSGVANVKIEVVSQ